jgi:hypothetical protein
VRRTFDDAATFVFMSRLLEQLSNVGWKTNYRITVSISIVAYRSCQSLDRYYDVLKIKKKKNSPCITCSQGRIQVLSTAEAKAATNAIQYFFEWNCSAVVSPQTGNIASIGKAGLRLVIASPSPDSNTDRVKKIANVDREWRPSPPPLGPPLRAAPPGDCANRSQRCYAFPYANSFIKGERYKKMSCFVILCYSGNLNVNGAARNDAREAHPKETQQLTVITENGYYKIYSKNFNLGYFSVRCVYAALLSVASHSALETRFMLLLVQYSALKVELLL